MRRTDNDNTLVHCADEIRPGGENLLRINWFWNPRGTDEVGGLEHPAMSVMKPPGGVMNLEIREISAVKEEKTCRPGKPVFQRTV